MPEALLGRALAPGSSGSYRDRVGGCEFSRKRSPGEGLPAVVVDEEVYRLLPGLVIATVDKFAQMAWNGAVQTLFGRILVPRSARTTGRSMCSWRRT